ncbi:hypothetical protein Taro_000041 [Colocasia esculenta]|uniref:Uncharacterized protein n=1 Tax=Colocasia esculenta TaxID=4460 RepID=A0A843TBY2_COLES|nr:hypothetical protein [Colocasia esculenta]
MDTTTPSSAGLPSHEGKIQHPGCPTRSSFTTEGNYNTLDTPPGLPSQQKGNNQQTLSRKSKPLDQAFASADNQMATPRYVAFWGLIATAFLSRPRRRQVAADEKGKKNGLVWAISCSPATKNSSTRPQQDILRVEENFISELMLLSFSTDAELCASTLALASSSTYLQIFLFFSVLLLLLCKIHDALFFRYVACTIPSSFFAAFFLICSSSALQSFLSLLGLDPQVLFDGIDELLKGMAALDEMEAYIATVQSHEREKASVDLTSSLFFRNLLSRLVELTLLSSSVDLTKLAGQSGSVDLSVK